MNKLITKNIIIDYGGTNINRILEKGFTKKDIKSNHIVKDRNGKKDIASIMYWRNYNDDLTFKAREMNKNDIMEVYEFDKLVWKRKEKPIEILDKEEKRWLNSFIKSTKIKVDYIKKWLCASQKNEYLQIVYYVFNYETKGLQSNQLFLPIFEKNSMYKGMERNKEYTLKELGL